MVKIRNIYIDSNRPTFMVPNKIDIFYFEKSVWPTNKVHMNDLYRKSRDEDLLDLVWYIPDHKQISNVELDISIST